MARPGKARFQQVRGSAWFGAAGQVTVRFGRVRQGKARCVRGRLAIHKSPGASGKGTNVITAIATLKGTSPYSQSKVITTPKGPKETHDEHEQRTWKERLHVGSDGLVFIPPNALKNSLSEAAKYLTKQIPGKGKSTYTKHFEAGVMCLEPIELGIRAEDVPGERLHVPADGKRGGTKRVWKTFPRIDSGWEGIAEFSIFDPLITEPVFLEHLEECGRYIGIGRFRPRNNGYYGRFEVTGLEWRNGK